MTSTDDERNADQRMFCLPEGAYEAAAGKAECKDSSDDQCDNVQKQV